MPVEGFKSVTIPEDIYLQLKELAESNCRSIPKTIKYLLENHKEA